MSNYIKDPTAGAAIGSIDREFNALRKWALKIQSLKKSGLLTAFSFYYYKFKFFNAILQCS